MIDPQVSFSLHAWVDESMQMPTQERVGMYVLAAAIADPEECEPVRDSLRELLKKKGARFHWRDESAQRHLKIASAIGAYDKVHLVVVGVPIDPRRQERARRLCMERLLHELEKLGVTRVWLESRTESLNRSDIRLVDAVRNKGRISPSTHVDFANPTVEPMLWVPDAVAGITAHARGGRALDVRLALGDGVEEVNIELL
ncbi:hypothetical protein L1785_04735 [Antribacter sp. KLBMP9083]|uniref:DUF3800 domain-containing protein n=1 Tax=Antribacter soli TaxID=2910976 RepID=A0AA41QB99_9MICO|nr:hypothetical protein [Antribacter soli]MCF4120280.1 hypothetical protein [Antribacter soli]